MKVYSSSGVSSDGWKVLLSMPRLPFVVCQLQSELAIISTCCGYYFGCYDDIWLCTGCKKGYVQYIYEGNSPQTSVTYLTKSSSNLLSIEKWVESWIKPTYSYINATVTIDT